MTDGSDRRRREVARGEPRGGRWDGRVRRSAAHITYGRLPYSTHSGRRPPEWNDGGSEWSMSERPTVWHERRTNLEANERPAETYRRVRQETGLFLRRLFGPPIIMAQPISQSSYRSCSCLTSSLTHLSSESGVSWGWKTKGTSDERQERWVPVTSLPPSLPRLSRRIVTRLVPHLLTSPPSETRGTSGEWRRWGKEDMRKVMRNMRP